jgi:hypothetical protein
LIVGLLSGLLLLPITGPVHGLQFILEQIQAQVDAELLDDGRLQAELMTLSMRHELGEISDAEYEEQEAALLEELNAIRAYKEDLIRATSEAEPGDDGAES